MEPRKKQLSTGDIASGSEEREIDLNAEVDSSTNEKGNAVLAERGTEIPASPPPGMTKQKDLVPLFSNDAVQDYRSRWNALQTGFVDEPRHAVEEADELVAQVIKDLAETFSDERSKLEKQWDQGDKVSTEDLRLVLQRYRSFFDRFLSV
jgi:hypothetical protein